MDKIVIDKNGRICSVGDKVIYGSKVYEIVHISGLVATLYDEDEDKHFNMLSYNFEKYTEEVS